jgi:hypothetical protein
MCAVFWPRPGFYFKGSTSSKQLSRLKIPLAWFAKAAPDGAVTKGFRGGVE